MTKILSVDDRGLKASLPSTPRFFLQPKRASIQKSTGNLNLRIRRVHSRVPLHFDAYSYIGAGRTINLRLKDQLSQQMQLRNTAEFGLNLYGSAMLTTQSRQFTGGYPDVVSVYAFRVIGRVWHATINGRRSFSRLSNLWSIQATRKQGLR